MSVISGILLLFILFLEALGDTYSGGSTIRLEKFDQCPDKMDMPNVFVGSRVTQAGLNDVSIHGTILVRQEVVEPASLKITLHKCASKDAPDTCEYYYTYATNDFCKLISMKNQLWSSFWKQTDLPTSCPLKVGNYSMNGAKLSMPNIPDSPFLKGFWKVRSTGKAGGKSWHCAYVEFVFDAEVKKRKRGKSQG